MTDKYLFAQLYTAKEEEGYITKEDILNNPDFLISFSKANEVGRIIIKNNIFIKNNIPLFAKELITGVPIDIVCVDNGYSGIIARLSRKELDAFAYVDKINRKPTVDDLIEYKEKHKDVLNYKSYLSTLINKSKANHLKIKKDEIKGNVLVKKK